MGGNEAAGVVELEKGSRTEIGSKMSTDNIRYSRLNNLELYILWLF
jgi:hypothetical protein